MRTPLEALNEIAFLIHIQASCKEQDSWLRRAIEAGHVGPFEEEE